MVDVLDVIRSDNMTTDAMLLVISIALDTIWSDNADSVTDWVLSYCETWSDRIAVESYSCSLAMLNRSDNWSSSVYSETSAEFCLMLFISINVSKDFKLVPMLIISWDMSLKLRELESYFELIYAIDTRLLLLLI